MKRIGIALLLAGLVIGVLYPWARVNFLGKQVTEVQLNNLDFNAKQSVTFTLSKADNPVRARFLIKYKRDAYLPPVSIPVFVRIDGPGNLSHGTTVSFPTDGRSTAPEAGKIASGRSVDFSVKQDGLHKISLELAPNQNAGLARKPDIENITVKFVANVAPKHTLYQELGIVIAVLGFYLFARGRRRPKNNVPPQWGRG